MTHQMDGKMTAWCHHLTQVSLDLYRGGTSTYRDKVWTCRDRLWILRSSKYDFGGRVFVFLEKLRLLLKLLTAVAGLLLFLSLYLNKHYFNRSKLPQNMLVTDHRLERVEKVVQTIVQSNPDLQDIKAKLISHVLNDSRASAYANRRFGYIVVFTGMLEFVSSDDELSFVLGHEIAHVVLNSRRIDPGSPVTLFYVSITGLLVMWLTFRSFCLAILTFLVFFCLIIFLIILHVRRHCELDADYFGIAFAAKAGFDMRQAGRVMRKLSQLGRDRWTRIFPAWLSTHPDAQERAAYLDFFDQDFDSRRQLIPDVRCSYEYCEHSSSNSSGRGI